jgi:hypothetical protein
MKGDSRRLVVLLAAALHPKVLNGDPQHPRQRDPRIGPVAHQCPGPARLAGWRSETAWRHHTAFRGDCPRENGAQGGGSRYLTML